MSREIEPSQRAVIAVERLARKAAKTDSWLEPCFDDIEDGEDHGEIGSRHREQWEETCHWQHFYGNEISAVVDQQEQRLSPNEPLEFEKRYYGLYLPLVDAFWEEWEQRIGFWDALEAALAETADAETANA